MRHHLGFYNSVGVTAYYRTRSPIPLKTRIFSAVATVIQAHPILSAIPIDEGSKSPYFARLKYVDLERCVHFIERRSLYEGGCLDLELDELIAAQHNKPFEISDGTCPFWRLEILLNRDDEASFAACFIYHHAIGDGASGKAFHRAFLDSILGVDCAPLSSTMVPFVDGPLLPALETLHPLPLSLMALVKALYLDTFSSVSQNLWSGGPVIVPLVSRFRSFSFLPKTTSRFTVVCRREGTTVTAALQTLLAAALFKFVPERYSELTGTVPVSLRRWMPPPVVEDSIGVWVASLEETYHKDGFSWEEVRRCRQMITKFLAQNGKDTNVGLLRWLNDYKSHFTSKIGTKRATSFEISNIGSWSSDETTNRNGCGVGRMVFSQSASVTGAAIEVCVISGCDGCMTLGCAWQEGVVEFQLVEQVMGDIQKQVELLSNTTRAQ